MESTNILSGIPWFGMLGGGIFLLLFFWWLRGWRKVGPSEMGAIEKNWGSKSLPTGDLIAMKGERGWQARTLAPGWQWVPWLIYSVRHEPVVEVAADEEALILAQVGQAPPVGCRTAAYKPEFGDYQDVEAFLSHGGEKGRQRWVLRPGSYRIHPVAFLVITPRKVYGIPMDPELAHKAREQGLTADHFQLRPEDLKPIVIKPKAVAGVAGVEEDDISRPDPRASHAAQSPATASTSRRLVNYMGVVTAHEGPPLRDGQLACRLGGWDDIEKETDDKRRINAILSNRNTDHQAYQDFEAFLNASGQAGLQHDPITEGTFYFNPWLVRVEQLPVLHVMEGEVAVIKSRVGLVEQDISGAEFKFGSIVRPGHRGLWSVPIRTGSWMLNPRCYEATIVPTKILTLYWADNINAAGKLDEALKTIKAKSKDGFGFSVELQVQIHISDVNAPRVISMVGSVQNLVNEVLQSAVGNYFRNKIQAMQATEFIQQREKVQEEAFKYIEEKLKGYEVETLGVFLQDIQFPEELAKVLKEREIAAQEIETFGKQKDAQDKRLETEKARGLADQQAALATSEVSIKIEENNASAKKKKAEGESYYAEMLGKGEGAALEAKGRGLAAGLQAQRDAVGDTGTVLVNVVKELVNSRQPLMPQVLTIGTGGGGAGLEGALSTVTAFLHKLASTPAPGSSTTDSKAA